jgi:Saxitoxin biosynthesis operon protein SxtJ
VFKSRRAKNILKSWVGASATPIDRFAFTNSGRRNYMFDKEYLNTQLPSNKKFGRLFTFVFAAASVYVYLRQSGLWFIFPLGLALFVAGVTMIAPKRLTPFNQWWFNLGMLMGKVVSPIVLGLIFFLLITPVSLITRLFGRDVLRLKRRNAQSYWIERKPHGPDEESFRNQF